MSLERARILKAEATSDAATRPGLPKVAAHAVDRARRIAAEVIEARAEAGRILQEAHAGAAAVAASAAERAAEEARAHETGRLAAVALALAHREDARAARDLDRTIALATLLAERLVGEAIAVEPARIGELAAAALQEARGARRVRIDACPADIEALTAVLGTLGHSAEVHADEALGRGSLVVHTDLGVVDAKLAPQLDRLASALREALTTSDGGATP